ncbi:hypothetical protein LCD36_04790 [Saccharopolyspora sp. 6T]|uniref:hypothetical protein n=1 Tax=Saccharopolyspora sp. 6T TaxID=2877238 RepID=UPI001CD50E2F|nr:hypothetical protein [Saccharopolyspora sp. 6T]MCA1185769.1 hypothetical protein [Saccharopolyspora sp. 6T]
MDFTVGDRVRSLRWADHESRISGRIEPGGETNEYSDQPRLFVHFDGTSFEREVEPDEIERTTA